MSIEAMKQALEDLESVLCDPEGNVCWHGSYADRDIIGDALDVFRTAIEQAEKQEPVAWCTRKEIDDMAKGFSQDVPARAMRIPQSYPEGSIVKLYPHPTN